MVVRYVHFAEHAVCIREKGLKLSKETIEELAKLSQHDEDFVTVTEYADNTIRGTDRTKHWRIGGA